MLIPAVLVYLVAIACTVESNGTDWCAICKCNVELDLFTLNCAGRSLQHFPSSWPSMFTGSETEAKHIVATFDDNGIASLDTIPSIKTKELSLSMRRCNLSEIHSAIFTNIKSIRYLDLGFNKLTGDAIRSEIFKGPFNIRLYEPIDLEVLILESNQIHSLERRMFQHIPNLKVLNLSNNPMRLIDSVTALAISSASKLEELDLSYAGLKTVPDDLFRNLKHLSKLNLSGNKLTTVPESIAAVASSLRTLILSENLIQEINDNSFMGLWRVEFLEVGKMETLTSVKAGSFAQLKSLQILHLCHNKNLKEISYGAFGKLKSHWPVKELYLNDNNLRVFPGSLALWGRLTSLNLENNPWECDCDMALDMITRAIATRIPTANEPKCMSPIKMSGVLLRDLKPHHLCSHARLNGSALDDNSPPPMTSHKMLVTITKQGNVFVGFILVVVAMSLGLTTGYIISCLRRKLKDVQDVPVRYTNVAH